LRLNEQGFKDLASACADVRASAFCVEQGAEHDLKIGPGVFQGAEPDPEGASVIEGRFDPSNPVRKATSGTVSSSNSEGTGWVTEMVIQFSTIGLHNSKSGPTYAQNHPFGVGEMAQPRPIIRTRRSVGSEPGGSQQEGRRRIEPVVREPQPRHRLYVFTVLTRVN